MVNVRTAGRESMVATPRAGRARRLTPSLTPEPSQGASQASLPIQYETLVMEADDDMREEEELDQLDELQSDDRHDEDELASGGNPDDDEEEVDELEDDASEEAARFAVPGRLSPSLTQPSVEAMLDQREETSAAAAVAAAAAAAADIASTTDASRAAASPPAPPNAVSSSSRSPEPEITSKADSMPKPRFDFFCDKTFFIAGRRPVKSDPAAELDDIRYAIRNAGGLLVKLSDGPTYVIEVGELSAAMEARIEGMEDTELLSVPDFRKLFGMGLKRASKAARRAAQLRSGSAAAPDKASAEPARKQSAQPASETSLEGGEPMDDGDHVPTIEEPNDEAVEESTDEHPGVEVSAETSATGAADDGVLFKDKNGLVLIFEIQPELASGVKESLRQLILKHGGQLTTRVAEADIRLVDPTTTKGKAIHLRENDDVPWRCRPWHWVPACIVRGKLLKPDVMDSRLPVFVRNAGGEQLRICVVDELEDRSELEKLVQANGGRLVDEEHADVIVIDKASDDPVAVDRIEQIKTLGTKPRLALPAWVRESVAGRERCRLPKRPAPAKVGAPTHRSSSPMQAPPSAQPVAKSPPLPPAAPRRPGRPAGVVVHEFTPDDDRNMVRYMAAVLHHQKTKPPSTGQNIGATGNRIFQDMCAEPEVRPWTTTHTWQSWRNRFMKKRSAGFEAALDRRMLKLKQGNAHCPMLEQLQTRRTGRSQPRSTAAPRLNRPPSAQSENIENAEGESELEGAASRAQAQDTSTAPKKARLLPPRVEAVVAPDDGQSLGLADVLPPNANRRSPTIPLDGLLDDDIRSGGMDYVPDVPREVSVPPFMPPDDCNESEKDADASANDLVAVAVASGAAQQPDPVAATSSTVGATVCKTASDGDDDDDDDDDDGTGQATQVMHTTLAALAGGIPSVDPDETESEDDGAEAADSPIRTSVGPKAPEAPLASSDAADVEQSDEESGVGNDPGGATLAMQALMDHVAEPINSDDSSDDEDLRTRAAFASQPAEAPLRARSPSPLPPARSSRETTPTGLEPTKVAEAKAMPTSELQPNGLAHKPLALQAERPTPLSREKRRLSRPMPRKSLDLPGIGQVPHFDLGGPASKKPRMSGRTESAASTTPAPRTLSPKEQVVAWAIEMETKYAVDRRRCTPFLQAVYPEFGAAERILFASLPLEDGHVWTPDEDAALLEMQGLMLEQLEATLGEPACYRRLRLLKRHRRDAEPVRF